jgi:hypothetical protein
LSPGEASVPASAFSSHAGSTGHVTCFGPRSRSATDTTNSELFTLATLALRWSLARAHPKRVALAAEILTWKALR